MCDLSSCFISISEVCLLLRSSFAFTSQFLNILEYLVICYPPFFLHVCLKSFILQIRDDKNKLRPIALALLIGVWREKCGSANCDESMPGVCFISEVSEELSSQLQSGIMKIARRALLDEITSSVISDFLKEKKRDDHPKTGSPSSAAHVLESISVTPFVFTYLFI